MKDSGNPGMLEAYLAKFPDGEFRALAEILLAEIGTPDRPTRET